MPINTRGFTLPELLAGVAIMGVLGAVATPGISQLIDNQRVKSASSDLFSALVHARSEAVRRNTEVTVFPVTEGAWEDGWTVPDPADTAVFFLRHEAVANTAIDGPDSVVFLGNGRVKPAASAPEFAISAGARPDAESAEEADEADDAAQRCIKLDLAGRPTILKQGC